MKRMLSGLLAVALFALPAAAEETYNLQAVYKKGQKFTLTKKMAMDLKGTVTQQGNAQPFGMKQTGTEKYTEEVLDAKDGKPTWRKRQYLQDTETQEIMGQKRSKNNKLHGKTVEWKVGEDGKATIIQPKDMPELGKKFSDDSDPNGWLPKKPVAVGHKWTLKGYEVAKAFKIKKKEFKDGKLEAHFVEVTKHKGVKAAKIAVTFTITGEIPQQQLEMSMKLSGFHYIDLEKQEHLAFDVKGTVRMKSMDNPNAPMTMDLKGPFSVSIERNDD